MAQRYAVSDICNSEDRVECIQVVATIEGDMVSVRYDRYDRGRAVGEEDRDWQALGSIELMVFLKR